MPSEFGFEPHSPRYGPFLVLGLFDTKGAQSRPFLAILGPLLGHIAESEGNKGLFVTSFGRLEWGRFGPKKLFWGKKRRSFGRAPPAIGEFLAQKLEFSKATT